MNNESWSIEDVQSVRPDLDDEQAATVLEYVLDNHDATQGINWYEIDCAADCFFGESRSALEKAEDAA